MRSSGNSGIAGHPDLPEMERWLRNWRESYVPSSSDWVFLLQPWLTGLLYYSICLASAYLFIYVSFQLSSFFTLPTSSSWGESDLAEGHMVILSQSAVSKEGVMWYRPWPPVLNEPPRAPSSRDDVDLHPFIQMGCECGRHWDISDLSEDGLMIKPMNIHWSLKFRHSTLGCDNNLNWHTSILNSSYSLVNL